MKKISSTIWACLLLLGYSCVVNAELQKNLNESISNELYSGEQLVKSNKDYTVPLGSKTIKKNSDANSNFYKQGEVSKSPVVIDRELDKNKLLRCWQDGRLILTENGWDSNSQLGSVISSKGNQKMRIYSFDDTFCVYLGG